MTNQLGSQKPDALKQFLVMGMDPTNDPNSSTVVQQTEHGTLGPGWAWEYVEPLQTLQHDHQQVPI